MKYHFFLGLRWLTNPILVGFPVTVVAVSVFVLIPVLAVMEGFKVEMRKQIRGSLSDLEVRPSYGAISMFGEDELAQSLNDFVLVEDLMKLILEERSLAEAVTELSKLSEIVIVDPSEYPDLDAVDVQKANLYRLVESLPVSEVLNALELDPDRNRSPYGAGMTDLERRFQPVVGVSPFVESIALPADWIDSLKQPCLLKGINPEQEILIGDFQSYILRDDEIVAMTENPRLRLPETRPPVTVEEIEHLFSRERVIELMLRADPELTREVLQDRDLPEPIVVGIGALRSRLFRLGEVSEIYSWGSRQFISRDFIVVGGFQTKISEQDTRLIYMDLQHAQNFLDLYDERWGDFRFSGFSVNLHDFDQAADFKRALKRSGLGFYEPRDIYAITWEDQRRNLLAAVDTEKNIIYAMMLLPMISAGVVVFMVLSVLVIYKTRDIGVLRSVGATRKGIVMLFTGTGLTVCVVGTALGFALGLAFSNRINDVHDFITDWTGWTLFPPDIYYLSEIPTAYKVFDWVLILGPAILLGLFASLAPAIWAAVRDPIKALHHE